MRNRGFLIGLLAIAAFGTLLVLKGSAIERALLRLHGIHVESGPARRSAGPFEGGGTDVAAAGTPADRDGWPETHAGVAARHWVEGFSAGERAMHDTIASLMAPERLAEQNLHARLERYRDLHARLGSLSLLSVGASEPAHLEVTLTDSDGAAHVFVFDVQPAAPHKLLRVSMRERGHHGFGGGEH